MQLSALERMAQIDAPCAPADAEHLPIPCISQGAQRFDNAARHRIFAQDLRAAVQERRRLGRRNLLALAVEPFGQLLKGDHRVDLIIVADVLRLIDLCDARPRKHDAAVVAISLPQQAAMGNHWGDNRGHLRHQIRIIFLHQVIERRAAGGEDIIHLIFFHKTVVFSGDVGRALARLGDAVEAESLNRPHKFLRAFKIERSKIRRRKGNNHAVAVFQVRFDPIHGAGDRLGTLRTFFQTGPAQNAGAVHDLRLLILHLNGFHRADLDALVAVFTVSLFQADNSHNEPSFSIKSNRATRQKRTARPFRPTGRKAGRPQTLNL